MNTTMKRKPMINTIYLEELNQETNESHTEATEDKTYTVEDAVETIGFGRFHILLFFIMGSTSIVEATEIMLLAVVSPAIRCEWRLEDWQVAFVTTMVFLGFMVCSLFSGYLADKYGRWKFFWLIGSLMVIVLGLAVVPTYGWRWLIRISTIPSIVLIVLFKFIPESARYNVSSGNTTVAIETLQKIAKMNRACLPEGRLVESIVIHPCGFSKAHRIMFNLKVLLSPCSTLSLVDVTEHDVTVKTLEFVASFSYYGIILASSELLERNLVCGTQAGIKTNGADEYLSRISYSCTFEYRNIKFLRETTFLNYFHAGNWNFLPPSQHLYNKVYPTTMRSVGMGFCNSASRIGGMTAPFIAQVLMSKSVALALCPFSVACFICAVAVWFLPIETTGRALQVCFQCALTHHPFTRLQYP
ncbi:Synaptic vesicle 2-related protein [Acipenser ruthenus]|uniref:Synaptic vesicle 2-related protein n=1 Tax=Acipenser ruthenus TaxID=7906 RepID=A0A662Z0K1_ACIRT|nr:Synaptic vesicle 2-related protein [Acipenser ruthenus]